MPLRDRDHDGQRHAGAARSPARTSPTCCVARATGRRREISVRAALGAGRGRIIRQLLTESVVLSVLACRSGSRSPRSARGSSPPACRPTQVPYYIAWRVDWRTVAYSAVVALGTALALRAVSGAAGVARRSPRIAEGRHARQQRQQSLLRSTLVVVQVALALVSLVGALLFVRTFQNLDTANVGFDTRPLMTMRMSLPGEVVRTAERASCAGSRTSSTASKRCRAFRPCSRRTTCRSAAAAVAAPPSSKGSRSGRTSSRTSSSTA